VFAPATRSAFLSRDDHSLVAEPEENMGTWLDDDFYWEEWIIVV